LGPAKKSGKTEGSVEKRVTPGWKITWEEKKAACDSQNDKKK